MKQKKIVDKKYLISFICIVIILNVINIAKHLIRYDSPEEAYKAIYNRDVYAIVNGNKTTLVIGEKEPLILIKVGDKYRYPMNSSEVVKVIKNIDDYVICVYEYSEMDEYYMTVSAFEGIYPTLIDNRDTVFHRVEEIDENGVGTLGYFAYIDELDEDYEITIDSKSVKLLD